jgi:hypothetical protein
VAAVSNRHVSRGIILVTWKVIKEITRHRKLPRRPIRREIFLSFLKSCHWMGGLRGDLGWCHACGKLQSGAGHQRGHL